MKKAPNSKVNLDRALQRYAGDYVLANKYRVAMANAIVAQMIGEGVVKGGSGLKFRYGDKGTRYTMDLDTAWQHDLDSFLKHLKLKLSEGWNGFTGVVVVKKQASPRGIPFDYVMQPCDVKLSYKNAPWFTVALEVGHNEIGDADACERIALPKEVSAIFEFLCLPIPSPIPAMRLEYQVAQKLHGVSAPGSKRAHDLIDLQLICRNSALDMPRTAEVCRRLFAYRKTHAWPPCIEKGEQWDVGYEAQRGALSVLPTVDEAVAWANGLIARLEKSSALIDGV